MGHVRGKKKFDFWAYPETLELMRNNYRKDHSRSQSEFLERAVQYYVGHINVDDDVSYLPSAILSNMKALINESDTRRNRLLFKLAVEMAMLMNIIAARDDIDTATLERLRGSCVKEVSRLNGNFSYEDAVKWQRG